MMVAKRPRSADAACGHAHDAPPAYRAASVRSGNVVVLGMRTDAALQCAGMALLRVFQGHVDILGWQPALGTYCSVYSPKWSSLLVVQGRQRTARVGGDGDTGSSNVAAPPVKKIELDPEYQASFEDANARLLAKLEPCSPVQLDLDEEHAADKLARDIAESYPIVLVLRALPVTYGNAMCYYEVPGRGDAVVLPGFKIIVTKDTYASLTTVASANANGSSDAVVARKQQTVRTTHDTKSSRDVLSELLLPDPSRTIHISTGWSSTLEKLERSLLGGNGPQRIVVCGGKDVGKSTFCRYLVNRLLSYYDVVAFLDTDLGQPELTPPGIVSLHSLVTPLLGPGFTHMKTPLRSFFCGGTNPGTDPLYYVKAVKTLLRLYERKWGAAAAASQLTAHSSMASKSHVVPLVINTDGWVKSMGHDLLCSVIQDADPHHVVQLLSTTRSKQFDVPTGGRWRVHSVDPWDPAASTVQAPRSSKEMRLYRIHSYFLAHSRCLLPRAQLQNLHFLTEKDRLAHAIGAAYGAMAPFVVSFDAVDVALAGASVPPSQLLLALNCSIVGLCINSQRAPVKQTESEGNDNSGIVRSGPPRVQLQPVHAPCVGVGLVRAIDAANRRLFLLSPLPLATLRHVNLLVRGSISLDPLLLGMESGSSCSSQSYVVNDVVASEGTGSSAMQSRNNIKRKRDAAGKA